MSLGGRICPYCKRYTAKEDNQCLYCSKFIGPAWLSQILKVLNTGEMLATNTIVILCVLGFMAEVAVATATVIPTPTPLDFIFLRGVSAEVMVRLGALATGYTEPWRLVASCFLHMGLLHLAMNMWAFYDFGRLLEPMLKWPRFFVSFFVTGVVGFLVSNLWYNGELFVTAGASGAVFGIQGLLLGEFLARKDPRFKQFFGRTLMYSFIFYYAMGTNQAAHLGGLGAGMALGFFFAKETRPWQRDLWFKLGSALCLLSLVVVVFFASR